LTLLLSEPARILMLRRETEEPGHIKKVLKPNFRAPGAGKTMKTLPENACLARQVQWKQKVVQMHINLKLSEDDGQKLQRCATMLGLNIQQLAEDLLSDALRTGSLGRTVFECEAAMVRLNQKINATIAELEFT
jgi:hypothetical protein